MGWKETGQNCYIFTSDEHLTSQTEKTFYIIGVPNPEMVFFVVSCILRDETVPGPIP